MDRYDQEKTDREKYLEYELERYQEQERRRLDNEDRERKQRRGEWEEKLRQLERTADFWPEALRKNIVLFRREAYPDYAIPEGDSLLTFFELSAQACEKALLIWNEVESEIRPKINELEALIVTRTAEALEKSDSRKEFQLVANAMREGTPEDFLNW